ncbi:hypothetical protein F5Y04DRAFT_213455 [Hypomontagnella monticulosa]|nr:hypothetical protein F5Y04DRAFT_213455 [Hypomontagnella monticulosa]
MPLQIPHPNTTLHLYRHILREATYLPPLCQPYITQRIKTRFRDCLHKPDPKPYIKDAHHSLRYLRSANAGHVERLVRLCFMATGRVGKRRRVLAKSELSSRPALNSAELDEKTRPDNDKQKRPPDWLDNWSIEKVTAIAQSQSQISGANWPFSMRRSINPARVIPTENCFGRPLSKKLARNKLKRHWISVLRRLLPPLPAGEWDQLGAMARGEADAQHYKMPTRRPVAQSHSTSLDTKEPKWADFVTKPVRSIERGNSRKMKSLSGCEDEDPRGHGRPIGLRVLGRRKLRRAVYGRAWEASPMLTENPKFGKWSVVWGNSEPVIPRPSEKDMRFFRDTDAAGVPIQTTSRTGTAHYVML